MLNADLREFRSTEYQDLNLEMSKMRADMNRRLAKIEGDLIKQGKNISKASQASFTQMSGDKTESKLVSYEDRIKELETFKISTDLTL